MYEVLVVDDDPDLSTFRESIPWDGSRDAGRSSAARALTNAPYRNVFDAEVQADP